MRVELETYARANPIVKPFLLVIARDTMHASHLLQLIQSEGFFEGRYREKAVGYEVKISKGFTELKPSAYTTSVDETTADYRVSPSGKSNMAKYLFGGFARCLYPVQKFDSEAERKLSVILDRDTIKWFKPAKGQFQIFYRNGADHLEYQPDFVAETAEAIFMLESKASNQLDDPTVLATKDATIKWCANASNHAHTDQRSGCRVGYTTI
ncbi:MAG: hypothetical protein ACRERU_09570 [Methylococcales bacterium]